MMHNEWKMPLNLAVGFHLLVALSALYLPGILDSKPKFEDIYTVDLINLAEQALPPAPPQATAPPQPAEPEVVPKDAVSIAKPQPAPQPEARPISIKPLKRKIKRKLPEQKPVVQKRDAERLKREKLAEALRAEQEAAEAARIAAEEAAIERKLREIADRAKTVRTGVDRPARSGSASSALERQYYASLIAHLQSFWSLPEYKVWDPSLQAIVVVTINKNGQILDSFFEQRSGDRVFDQLVRKTIQDAKSLPPIPAAMRKQRIEFGLRFSPEGIQY